MTKGAIAGDSIRPLTPANVVWIDQSGGSSLLTSAGMFAWSKSPQIPAFDCEHCRIIELRYEVERDRLLE